MAEERNELPNKLTNQQTSQPTRGVDKRCIEIYVDHRSEGVST